MKTKTLIIIILIIGLLAFIKIEFFAGKSGPPAGKAGVKSAVFVTGYVVHPENVNDKITASGTLLANKEVMLVPETSGKIVSINFTEGSNVAKGDLLVKINDADLQAQLKRLKLQEKLASETEARNKQLLGAGGISQEEYDNVLMQYNSTKAEIELLEAQIAKTEIHAPFNGKIGLLNVYEGSYVNQTTAIASIQQVTPLKIDFNVPEKYVSQIKNGQSFSFSIAGDTSLYTASVTAVEPRVDVNTRTLLVRAMTPNTKGTIFPGVYANIEFPIAEIKSAIMIPTQAVVPILKGQKVFVSDKGSAKEIIIKTGLRKENKIQVTEGLQVGDTVIVNGIMQLKPGVPIKITSAK
jgi:membrane fusion protein (multidrug efflux system)